MPNENMKVIAIMSRKGGAGKTSLGRALVSAAMSRGKRCLVLDADPQFEYVRWAQRLKINDPLFQIEPLKMTKDLSDLIETAYENDTADYVVIDTKGADGAWADDVAAESDAIIVPMKIGGGDLEITRDTYNWYVGLRTRTDNPETLPSFQVILSDWPAKPSKTETSIEEQAIKLFPVMNDYFVKRKQHVDASEHGFLHQIAKQRRESRNPLLRHHAKLYDEAVEEAGAILDSLVGDK